MKLIFQEMGLTPIEADVWRLCTQFSPRLGDDDLLIMAEVLGFTLDQVRKALTHLQDVGLLQVVTAQSGGPLIVTTGSSALFRHPEPEQRATATRFGGASKAPL